MVNSLNEVIEFLLNIQFSDLYFHDFREISKIQAVTVRRTIINKMSLYMGKYNVSLI